MPPGRRRRAGVRAAAALDCPELSLPALTWLLEDLDLPSRVGDW